VDFAASPFSCAILERLFVLAERAITLTPDHLHRQSFPAVGQSLSRHGQRDEVALPPVTCLAPPQDFICTAFQRNSPFQLPATGWSPALPKGITMSGGLLVLLLRKRKVPLRKTPTESKPFLIQSPANVIILAPAKVYDTKTALKICAVPKKVVRTALGQPPETR
jgi:LPXTG-motif cell wall anchor domain